MTTTSAATEATTSSIGTTPHEPSIITSMTPLVLILAVFYMLIIRPQQKKLQEHQKTVSALKAGDKVVMNSGIIGTIVKADASDPEATLEIAKDVHIKVRKDMVTEIIISPTATTTAVEKKGTPALSAKTSKAPTKKSKPSKKAK